jgi:hypothetical protein
MDLTYRRKMHTIRDGRNLYPLPRVHADDHLLDSSRQTIYAMKVVPERDART